MPWLQLIINSSRQSAETIEDALLNSGAASVTFEDNADPPWEKPPCGSKPGLPACSMLKYPLSG